MTLVNPAATLVHIVYSDGTTACGASSSSADCLAWRSDRIESIVDRATFLIGPGGCRYVVCAACAIAHTR